MTPPFDTITPIGGGYIALDPDPEGTWWVGAGRTPAEAKAKRRPHGTDWRAAFDDAVVLLKAAGRDPVRHHLDAALSRADKATARHIRAALKAYDRHPFWRRLLS